jgi:hypothetical protein
MEQNNSKVEKSNFTNKSEAGKGDRPRNISKKFWDNYDEIDWSTHKKFDNTKKSSYTNKV